MEELKLIPPMTVPPDQFPSSPELPDGAKVVKWADKPGCMVDSKFDVVYDERDGETLHLQILMPMEGTFPFGPAKKRPLIVYVPGSAWRRQMISITIPRMMKIAERGYAVAIVQYRPSDAAKFPAQIEDAKSAIRFMRKNAEEYKIDPDRVAIWGGSSGGHTAVMTGVTGDGLLDNGLYGEFSCQVKCIVDWYGPVDISLMNYYPSAMDHIAPDSPEGMLIGGVNVLENPELVQKTVPMNYLSREKEIPPILIMHGSQDQLVPFNQSCRLYDKLKELDKNAEMYKLDGGFHGTGGFNSDEATGLLLEFISRYIG